MDIKNVSKILTPQSILGKNKVDKSIKSDMAHDRDGNGQMQSGSEQNQQGPMSDEQFETALDQIKNHQICKDHNLDVVIQHIDHRKIILLKEPNGKILRRITEAELWSLLNKKDTDKGQLLSKSA